MEEISFYQEKFLKHLDANPFQGEPATLYNPANYILQLGGKRMRPILLLMAYHAFDEDLNTALDAALAIEVFHNFTLAHDDIMDAAPLRRGQATLHEKFNIPVAILAGDVLMIKSSQLMLKNPGKADPLRLLSIFNQTAIEICEGQQLDMDFEKIETVSEAAYLKMITYKTAVLLGAAMQIGALMGGATEADAGHFYQFAIHLGLAFQIKDDYLDTFGDTQKVGKQAGGDILQNKKTLLMIRCLEQANTEERAMIFSTELAPDKKIAKVTGYYTKYQVDTYARELQEYYFKKALESLDQISMNAASKSAFQKFALWLLERTY